MRVTRNGLVLVMGTAVLGSVPWATGRGTVIAESVKAQLVQVVNTADEAVPVAVQGTTNVAGMVGLVPGASVGIAPSSNTVKVDSTAPVRVRDVDGAGRQPFRVNVGVTILGEQTRDVRNVFVVPEGKRLVVQHVALSTSGCVTEFDTSLRVILFMAAADNATSFRNPINFVRQDYKEDPSLIDCPATDPNPLPVLIANHPVLMYGEPGEVLGIATQVSRPIPIGGLAGPAVFGSVTGYLVDIP